MGDVPSRLQRSLRFKDHSRESKRKEKKEKEEDKEDIYLVLEKFERIRTKNEEERRRKFFNYSYDDLTPPDPPDLPFTLTLSPIELNMYDPITLTPIPNQHSYPHYLDNSSLDLDYTTSTSPPP